MSFPLTSLWRHGCRVFFADGAAGGMQSHWRAGGQGGLTLKPFDALADAQGYLAAWRSDPLALGELRWVVARTGRALADTAGADEVLRVLAERLVQRGVALYELHEQRMPLARLELPPAAAGAGAKAGAGADAGLDDLPPLSEMPAVPVPVAPLSALEEVQVEGAEVLPEVDQSMAQVAVSIKTMDDASASLKPAPDKVAQVSQRMTQASAELQKELDGL